MSGITEKILPACIQADSPLLHQQTNVIIKAPLYGIVNANAAKKWIYLMTAWYTDEITAAAV